MKRHHLAVIIPFYNPHEGWEHKVARSVRELTGLLQGEEFVLVIVNDGSTQKIDPAVPERLQREFSSVQYLSYDQNRGKGHALRFGVRSVEADYYIYTDFDFPFGYNAVYLALERLKADRADLIIGTRDSHYFSILPFRRKLISEALRLVNFAATGFRVRDTQAGLKGFAASAKEIFTSLKTDGYIFEFEFIRKCIRRGLRYAFIMVKPEPEIRFSNFGASALRRELKSFIKIFLDKS
jgi:glycosyltransferase involved in cell wall biosynthesis